MHQKSTECKGIFFPLDQFAGVFSLSPEQQSKIFFACLEYHTGKEPDLSDPVVRLGFSMMKGSFDRSRQKIVEVANSRSEAGKRSAAVRATNQKQATQANTNKPNNGEQTEKKGVDRAINLIKLNRLYPPISPKGEQEDKSDPLCDTGTRASSTVSDEPPNTFVKPTLEQVTAYVQEKGIKDIDPEEFIAVNERRSWTVKGKPMKSWQRVLQTWRQKRQSDQTVTDDDLFEAVWNEYPRKENKSAAFKAFKEAQKKGLPDDIVRRVHARKYSEDWLKDSGRFVPQLEKWLNNGGWNDAACDYGDPKMAVGWEEELAELSELSRMYNDGNPKPGEALADTYARIEKYGPLYNAKRNDMVTRGCRCV